MKNTFFTVLVATVALTQICGSCKSTSKDPSSSSAELMDETSEADTKTLIELGKINVMDRDSAYVLTAPHGKYDGGTGEIVEKTCETLLWDCVVSRGYRTTRHPFNVNRPTEGIGLPSSEEIHSSGAAVVYANYKKHVDQVSPENSRKILVEIHGNSRPGSIRNIEVALVNVSPEVTKKLKKLFEEKLLAHDLALPDAAGRPSIKILMEGIDQMTFLAGGVKRFGILGAVKSAGQKAIHFEFPRILRVDHEAQVSAYLAEILKEAESLLSEVQN